MTSRKPPSVKTPATEDPEFRGPERRRRAKRKTRTEVKFDAKGNPVLDVRVETPARRKDDDTIDLLECLDADGLSLADDEDAPKDTEFNPYDRD